MTTYCPADGRWCRSARRRLRLTYAQDYPSRPMRWLLGYTAGGTTDIISRLVTQPLTERLGQPFVIEPRPGAGTNLATEFVVRAAPDGYTLLFVGAPNAINASLYSNLNFNFVRDIAPVAGIASVPMVLIVHPLVRATTIPGFSPMPNPIPERSTWHRRALARPRTWRVSCSR